MVHFPALDGVTASRFGFVEGEGATLLANLYDSDVPVTGPGGETYRRARGMCIRAHRGVVLEELLVDPQTRHDITDAFARELTKVHAAVNGDGGQTELDYTGLRDDEEDILAYIVNHINEGVKIPQAVYQLLQHASHDSELELVENGNQSFTESDFSGRNYIPRKREVKDDNLHISELDYKGDTQVSLWYQYETKNGEGQEIPLTFTTEGRWVMYGHNVEYGEDVDGGIPEALELSLHGLLTGETPDVELSPQEARILAPLSNFELDGTETEKALQRCL